jgi:hypothetical protein
MTIPEDAGITETARDRRLALHRRAVEIHERAADFYRERGELGMARSEATKAERNRVFVRWLEAARRAQPAS